MSRICDDGYACLAPDCPCKTKPAQSYTADVVILVRRIDGGGWESSVAVAGDFQGGGTGPTASSAIDVAMNILYGDKNDWLNNDYGALALLDEPTS